MNIDMNIDVNNKQERRRRRSAIRQVRIRNVAGIRIIIAIAFAHIRYWICHCGRDRPRVSPARIDRDRAAGASRPARARRAQPSIPISHLPRAGARAPGGAAPADSSLVRGFRGASGGCHCRLFVIVDCAGSVCREPVCCLERIATIVSIFNHFWE